MKFFTPEQIGPKRHKTQDGFLVCEDVPIARTGEQLYRPEETPIEPDPNGGPTVIERREQDVFRPETIASFNGKPVVYEHPSDDVTPDSYASLAKGHAMNPRRGTGNQDQFLIADLFITDTATMMAIEQGKREISCGYQADFYQTAPGRGGQRNIIGNHVALVDRGRCGSECAINDHNKVCDCQSCKEKKETTMTKKTLEDRLMALFGVKDRAALDAKLKEEVDDAEKESEEEKKKAEDRWNAMDKRMKDAEGKLGELFTGLDACRTGMADVRKAFDSFSENFKKSKDAEAEAEKEKEKKEAEAKDKEIEGALEEEAPSGTGDKAKKARDSEYLADSFQQTVALAEILAPGIKVPVFDKAMAPRQTYDAICGFRRTALELAYNTPATRGVVDSVLGGKAFNLKSMNCHDVRNLFVAAGVIQKDKNTTATLNGGARREVNGGGANGPKPIQTVKDLEAANAAFYNGGKAN